MRYTASSRREFLIKAAAGAAAFAPLTGLSGTAGAAGSAPAGPPAGFKLKYAPPFGMFQAHAGKAPLDQLKFMADQGFRAFFDNDLPERPAAEQEAIAREAARLGLEAGPFVAFSDNGIKSFVLRDQGVRDMLRERLKTALETSKRTGIRHLLVVPGPIEPRLGPDYQLANVIENLKWCADICGPAGAAIVLEPLNPRDHPGLFLTRMGQAYGICKAVESPAVKILDDIYHQQVTEGDILPNIDACWDEIASFHLGDSPGRKEPGTGELNYGNIFRHINSKGYRGVLCMEHGRSKPGKEGELAVIAAYRAADAAV